MMQQTHQRKVPRCRETTRDLNSSHHQVASGPDDTTTTMRTADERAAILNFSAAYVLTIWFLEGLQAGLQ